MADTIREKIIDAIYDRLNDYAWTTLTDVGIFRGRSIFDPANPDEQLPLITILPGQEESTRTKYGTDDRNTQVSITCLMSLEDGTEVDALCEPVFGEMQAALFGEGPIIIDEGDSTAVDDREVAFQYRGGGIVEYPQELGPAIITITITAEFAYECPAGNPYL